MKNILTLLQQSVSIHYPLLHSQKMYRIFLVCSRWSQYGKYFFLISQLVRTPKTWYWHTWFEATATAESISLVFAYAYRNWCRQRAAAIATKAFPTLLPCPPPLSNCSFHTVSAPISCSSIPSYLYGAADLPLPSAFWFYKCLTKHYGWQIGQRQGLSILH